MTTAYTNIRVEPQTAEGRVFSFNVMADRGDDRVILARVNWQSGSLCHPWTETEAKCWADLFTDALRLKRENDKLRQELAGQGWQPIETVELYDHNKLSPTVMLYSSEFGIQLGRAVRFKDGTTMANANGFHGDWKVTHWQPLPAPPLCATQGNSLPADNLGGSVGRLSAEVQS